MVVDQAWEQVFQSGGGSAVASTLNEQVLLLLLFCVTSFVALQTLHMRVCMPACVCVFSLSMSHQKLQSQ